MRRAIGSALAVMLVMAVGQAARAQAPAPTPSGLRGGGFGSEYTQTPPSRSLVLDRWWMVTATPVVGPMLAPSTVAPSTEHVVQPTQAVGRRRTHRSLSRAATRNRVARGAEPAAVALPTGSLAWPSGTAVPLYTPADRYAAYGFGYAVSPYGTMDYGAAYKGMAWGGN